MVYLLPMGFQPLEDPDREEWVDDRFDYDEERVITLGLTRHGVLYVVSIETGTDFIRIISARKAEPHEIGRYHLR